MPEDTTGYLWDHEDCPEDDCDGELEQQDPFNVMCVSCERVWSHVKTAKKHYLQTIDFETVAEKPVAMTDGAVERFVEHPTPDRFFQMIGPAEIEMQPMDRDDVTFKTQLVPGGSFGFEITASYSYGGYDCSQHISLDREAAKELHERLGEVLEVTRDA